MTERSDRRLAFSDFDWGRTLGEGSYAVVQRARLRDDRDAVLKVREFAIKKINKTFIERENATQRRIGRYWVRKMNFFVLLNIFFV